MNVDSWNRRELKINALSFYTFTFTFTFHVKQQELFILFWKGKIMFHQQTKISYTQQSFLQV